VISEAQFHLPAAKVPLELGSSYYRKTHFLLGMQTDRIWTDNSKIVFISVIIFQIQIRIGSDMNTDQIINEYGYRSDIIGYRMQIRI
jgi:hypothetical protein